MSNSKKASQPGQPDPSTPSARSDRSDRSLGEPRLHAPRISSDTSDNQAPAPPSKVSEPSEIDTLYAALRGLGSGAPGSDAPTLAAAAVLWRRGSAGLEVFLIKRAASMAFMPGYWSFVGGTIRAQDWQVAVAGAHEGEREAACIAGLVRELEEEVGLRVPYDKSRFVPAGQWITPPTWAARYDAHYYLVQMPDNAPPLKDCGGEFVESAWVTPADALGRWACGAWVLSQPVRRVIEALRSGYEGASERCAAGRPQGSALAARAWEVIPGLYLAAVRTPTLPPATHTNCYIVGGRELVVIDPASPYDDERAALDQVLDELAQDGRRVREIWLTHHHGDHVGGAEHLQRRLAVPVAAHPQTIARLGQRLSVEKELHHGDTLELAGEPLRRLRVLFTPGHAPGHICVVEEHTRFVIAGDMVAGIGTIVVEPSEGDMGQYIDSLERMKGERPQALLPAHGPVIANAVAKLDEYIGHRRWREERVYDAVASHGPATAAELVTAAYRDVPAAVYPLAERSLLAHLAHLLQCGRVTRDGAHWRVVDDSSGAML